MAWVLGFIAADGCIVQDAKCLSTLTLSFGVAEKDGEILYKIKSLLKSEHNITKYFSNKLKNQYKYTLNITSKSLCNDLIDLGIVPRKSLILKWIDRCPKQYIIDLARGYIDGDGCINVSNYKNRKRMRVHILGTNDFLSGILHSIKIHGHITKQKSSNYYKLSYNDTYALEFLEKIYQGSTPEIRLERKYQKYLSYLADRAV
jgi:hypothetical protein